MSIVDWVDLLYGIYAAGVMAFMVFFAYRLTKATSK